MKHLLIILLLTICIGCGIGGGREVWYNPNRSYYEAVQDSRECKQKAVIQANADQLARHQEHMLMGTQNQSQFTFQGRHSAGRNSYPHFGSAMYSTGYRRVPIDDLASDVKTTKIRIDGHSQTIAGK